MVFVFVSGVISIYEIYVQIMETTDEIFNHLSITFEQPDIAV